MSNDQPNNTENYVHNYDGELTRQVIAGRTLEHEGAFFLPYLRDGMNILDCGCGPGTITVGLAQKTPTGQVTGIDISENQLQLARERAAELGLTNTTFETASAYELPYQDDQFDAVFSHAMLEHMQEPLAVIKEMYRVLKPGGIIGIRSPDLGGTLYYPAGDAEDTLWTAYVNFRRHRGGSPLVARQFRALLAEAGFTKTIGSSSTEFWGTQEQTTMIASAMIDEFSGSEIRETVIKMGWADAALLDNAANMWKEWGNHPGAFASNTWCEAVGWKE